MKACDHGQDLGCRFIGIATAHMDGNLGGQELLDTTGIEAFSMRKLAELLNIQAASLYWHFKSKQSIFQTLANEVAKEALQSAKLEGTAVPFCRADSKRFEQISLLGSAINKNLAL